MRDCAVSEKTGTAMADLRVDYQLLTSVTRTLSSLAAEFAHVDDQVSSYDPAYGSGAVTAAMGNFSGNWSNHRKTLLSVMENLGQLTGTAEQHFRQADGKLGSDLAGQ
jgi:uncharacterized protein YukE